ncbi:MAG: hypothetical protein IKA62_03800 [Clostridia bacterium]|nr:hypothetical protein [Clostridia bacterium]
MSLKSVLKNSYWQIRKRRFMRSQPNTFNISKRKMRKAYRYGFTPEEYVIYDLDNNPHTDYLSEFDRMMFRDQIKNERIIVDNKIVCYSILRNFVDVNTIYAYKLHGDVQCTMLEKSVEQNSLVDLLMKLGKLVYKKISLGGGKGFKLLEYTGDGFFINRTPCSQSDVENLFCSTDNYLVEEYCQQSEFENKLFPYSVNTIRVITVIHKNKTIEPILSMQRMGVDAEKCVDNACAGGLYAEIDVETGVLSAARSHAKEHIAHSYSNHPVTMTQIAGSIIPNWSSIVNQVVELHSKLRFTGLQFIAWDIALTDEGIKIIEANASCSMDFAQTFSGQKNGKIGAWMKEWRYIK